MAAAAGRTLGRFPQSQQIAFKVLGLLAGTSARWPSVARFRFGVPPVLFDSAWYTAHYPDAAQTSNPLLHYLGEGGRIGYNPNPHFDTRWYLTRYPDVSASGLNPLVHFVRYGAAEGRNPNLWFDVRYYELQHPGIAAGGINPLEHFLSTPPAQRRSPNAALSLEEYFSRVARESPPARASVVGYAPLSVVIPTRNRVQKLERMLEACRRHAGGCDLEFIVMDDGSTDSTPEFLRQTSAANRDVFWQSLPSGGPGRARNAAAMLAHRNVLLFLGDDILPANDDFFRVHARGHASNPETDFAVLGRVDWPRRPDFPIGYTMTRMLEDGAQFAFSRLSAGDFASWEFFYTSNVSVKKLLVEDWMADGFDTGFPGAALEDIEFAYRRWRSGRGLRLYYDPESVGLHDHAYTLETFLARQFFVGQSLRRMLELHPELLQEYGLAAVSGALAQPPRSGDAGAAAEKIRRLEAFALELEAADRLGSEPWHGDFLSALFELRMHEGYAASGTGLNMAAAREAMLERLFRRVPQLRRAGVR
jgi:glycosyltransferase involved in cell wall biosynthesis